MLVRRLGEADASAFRSLRLEGLQAHPDAFGSSWEEEVGRPLTWFTDNLRDGYVVGCEVGGALVGVAGLFRGDRLKTKHRATLWGMYVAPEARRRGIGAALIRQAIMDAREMVEEVTLTVAAHNEAAVRLYEASGFVRSGLDPHALKVEDRYVDEVLMRLVL